jgi:tetratricopeptide (TPR) repeat protein
VSGELSSLAMAYRALDDAARARELVEEAVAAARESGDAAREANATSNLAALLIDEGDVDPAIELLERTLVLDTQLQDAWGQAADHVNLAGAMLRAGRTEDAYRHLAENAEAGVALGDVDITVDIIGLLCAAHAQRRDAGRTARLLGTSQTMREQAELPLPPQDAAWLDGVVDLVRDQPDPETWRRQVAVGSGYSVEDALRDGLAQDDTRQAADGTTTATSSVG